MPPEVVKAWITAISPALAQPAIQKRLADLGSEVRPMSPEEFTMFMQDEETRLKALAAKGVLKGE